MLIMHEVEKRIHRRYLADGLNLHATDGSLYALVGKNGSGKTSAMRLCAGLIEPDRGTITIQGLLMDKKENRKKRSSLIGYMDEHSCVVPGLKTLEYLEFYAHIGGKYGLSARERCMELLWMAGLERRADALMGSLAQGTLRQIEFLRTLIHRPPLLLLDEPFADMTTQERQMIQEILSQLAAEGATIVLTSSSIPDVLEFCHQIGLIDEGHMLAEGSRDEVMGKIRESAPLYMEIRNRQELAVQLLYGNPKVTSLTYDRNYFMVHYGGTPEEETLLLRQLIDAGVGVSSFHRGQGSMEDLSSRLA